MLPAGSRYYRGRPVPVWQLVWPDAAGRWPWDEQATASSRTRQAFAWLPVERHPAGAWRLLGTLSADFPLAGEPDSWALTTRSLLAGDRPPSRVVLEDDLFDVLDDRGYDADDLCVTYLGNLVLRHPMLRQFADLEPGSAASAAGSGKWTRASLSDEQRSAGIKAWERGQTNQVTS